jgi:hypothetical protein
MEQFANNAQTTLLNQIGASDSSLVVIAPAAFPASGTFRVLIGSELIIVGAVAGSTFSSLTRGAEGTTAAIHPAGSLVTAVLTAGAMRQFQQDIQTETALFVPLFTSSYALPPATGTMDRITVKNLSGGFATVSPQLGDFIDGATSWRMSEMESITLIDYELNQWAVT